MQCTCGLVPRPGSAPAPVAIVLESGNGSKTLSNVLSTYLFSPSLPAPAWPAPEGFGNATRIDYGTGHELKFAAFLCILMKIGVIPKEDAAALVIKVITK